MQVFLITIFAIGSIVVFWQFFRDKYKLSPVWIMLSVWFAAIAISQLQLSSLEVSWSGKYWFLLFTSLVSFTLGFFAVDKILAITPRHQPSLDNDRLRWIIYFLFIISLGTLYLYYTKAGNFPLFAKDPDAFRFIADEKVPGLINYCAQLARIFIPLSFFLIFTQVFSWKKHWDLVMLGILGTVSLVLFTSRTQIFFVDLWVMALYLLIRRPNLKQALKFYPVFLIVSVLVLAVVPLYRQYKSYGSDYLGNITGIELATNNKLGKALLPIYVGVSFNQQALLHAQRYYEMHEVQKGKVSLDPFTNIFGKIIIPLNKYKSSFDLGEIFYSWWNTGTYLFPFVQDFGTAAFFWVPFVIAGILTLAWKYWQNNPNFLSTNLYAYAIFFTVMTVYLSFTVRAEMYLDLMLLFAAYQLVKNRVWQSK